MTINHYLKVALAAMFSLIDIQLLGKAMNCDVLTLEY